MRFIITFIRHIALCYRLYREKQSQRKSLRSKTSHVVLHQLSKSEEMAINSYWKGIHFDHRWTAYYNTISNSPFDARYLANDLYYTYIDSYFNNSTAASYLENKNFFSLLFPDIKQPKTIIRKMNGNYLSANYQPISKTDAIQLCIEEDEIIIKKSIHSCGGRDIFFWSKEKPVSLLEDVITNHSDCIVQCVIKQHPNISSLHNTSINTIRIMTLCEDNKVSIISCVIRIGINGSRVDNASQGGITCGILPNGHLKDVAYSFERCYTEHPQGAAFNQCTIPNFSKCIEIVKTLAPRISNTCRLASWDLSVDEEGDPILIEVNMNKGGIVIHQLSNGPLFGDRTYEIVQKALDAQKFTRINKLMS